MSQFFGAADVNAKGMPKRNNTLCFELADNSENGLDVICDKSLPTQPEDEPKAAFGRQGY